MTKDFKLLIVLPILLLIVMVGVGWAFPTIITCPIDGDLMTFDHIVPGYEGNFCWYSHLAAHGERHTAYIPCEN